MNELLRIYTIQKNSNMWCDNKIERNENGGIIVEEIIIRLREKIEEICNIYVDFNKADMTGQVQFLMQDINSFTTWFIGTDDLGLDSETKVQYNNNLLGILNDIVIALKNHDSALMYDALYCGLLDYLNLFEIEGEGEES